MKSLIEEIAAYVKERNINIYGISEILNGEEKSVEIVPAPRCSDVYSVSKFVTGAAVALLWDRGQIDLHKSITEIIKNCPVPAEAKWNNVTVHNCLRHKTGLLNGNLDIDDKNSEGITDWLSYILALPIEGERETERHYTDAAYYLVCRVAESLLHENVYDFIHRELLTKLDFCESAWSCCPCGFVTGGSGFFANDRDLARLGYLWADGGSYKGRQLISPEYIKLSMQNNYGIDSRTEYSGCYYKTGANGQILLMIPEEKYVLAIRGYYSSDFRTELVDRFFTK